MFLVNCIIYGILFRLAYPRRGYDLCLTRDATDQYNGQTTLEDVVNFYEKKSISAIFAPCLLKPYGLTVTRSRIKTCIWPITFR